MHLHKLLVFSIALILSIGLASRGQRVPDPDFDTKVTRPAYTSNGPRVLFDEAHHNLHTATGLYKPFADLITSDGYRVTSNTGKFTHASLHGFDILVIANALGGPAAFAAGASNPAYSAEASLPAFTEEECDVVRDWVAAGHALLLIVDHAPMGAANERLGRRFDIDMSNGHPRDAVNTPKPDNMPGLILYTRERGLFDHPVTSGRGVEERVATVLTFTGQSLKGPAGSVAFMQLADTAVDHLAPPQNGQVSASGRAQGIALSFGDGRAVVLAEAGMLSAQLAGPNKARFGMNRPGTNNRQLAINIMHWLSRKI
ncbi:MAG: hypothetical protein ABIS06_10105 [Vicinamibacterales bacterium]